MISRIVRELSNDPSKVITKETLIAEGIDPNLIPTALHDVIAANDDTPLAPLLALEDDIFDLCSTHPVTHQTPIVAALKNRNAKGERRWDQIIEMISCDKHHTPSSQAGYALLIAAKENYENFNMLIKHIDDFSYYSNSNGFYPQHWAVANDNAAILTMLLEHKADVDEKSHNIDSVTPLQLALAKPTPNHEIITCLLSHHASIEEDLDDAASKGEWDKVKLVFMLDSKQPHPMLAASLMRHAIYDNRADIVSYLLQYGAELTCIYYNNNINLCREAAVGDHWECVEAMLAHENKTVIIPHLPMLLAIAAASAKWDIVEIVLTLQTTLNTSKMQNMVHAGLTTLSWLIKHHQNDFILRFLAIGIEIQGDMEFETAMQVAVQSRNATAVTELARRGESVSSVLKHAAKSNNIDEIHFLLEHDKRDHTHSINSLLFVFAAWNAVSFIKELLTLPGISITEAVQTAVERSAWEELKVLLDADPDYRNRNLLTVALGTAIRSNKPDIIQRLVEHGADVSTNSRASESLGYDAALIAVKIPDTLQCLINAGVNVNYPGSSVSLLHLAEVAKCQASVDILVASGAKHHHLIQNAARSLNIDDMFKLLKKHYEQHPNQNETREDKKILMGELLHTGIDDLTTNDWTLLIEMGADLTLKVNGENILTRLTKESHRSNKLLSIIPFLKNFPSLDEELLTTTLVTCINLGANINIITDLANLIKNLAEYRQPKTSNTFLHLAIDSKRVDYVELFANKGISKGAKNARGETPFMQLQCLAGYNSQLAMKLSMIVLGTDEWIRSLKIEKSREGVSRVSVTSSIERSMQRLRSRYRFLSISIKVMQYYAFLNSLSTQPLMIGGKAYTAPNKSIIEDGIYHENAESIRNTLAYVWTAACDETALTAEQISKPLTKAEIDDIVNLRKYAIVERFRQARVERKCAAGTRTLLMEALNHSHPDIFILYDDAFLEAEITEVVANKLADATPRLFNHLWTNDQHAAVKAFRQNPLRTMPQIQALSDSLKLEIKNQYHYISNKNATQIDKMLSPDAITKHHLYLPSPFIRLVAVLNEIDKLVSQSRNLLPHEEMTHLQQLVTAAESYSYWPRSLAQECQFLEDELEYCMERCTGISMKGLSVFDEYRAARKVVNQTGEDAVKLKL